MTRFALPLIVAAIGSLPFSFLACGGNMRPPDELPPVEEGGWPGHFIFSMAGDAPRSYDGTITLQRDAKEPRAVDVAPICPDGSGMVITLGFDGRYAWDGAMECENPTLLNGCPYTLRYTSVRVDVTDTSMTLSATGEALSAACERSSPTRLEFVCERRNAGQ